MILHLLRMRRNVNRNVVNGRKKCKRDTESTTTQEEADAD